MSKKQPDFVCATNPRPGSVVQALVRPFFTVKYKFEIPTKRDLSLPYAVAIDGNTLPEYQGKRPRVCKCPNGEITVMAHAGETVSLYLNSDAHPLFRQCAVYKVTVGDCNLEVLVKEAPCQGDKGKPMVGLDIVRFNGESAGKCGKVNLYAAWLTGEVWKTISHRYTVKEADDLIPALTIAEIRIAVLAIYQELNSPVLVVAMPKTDSNPACKTRIEFQGSDNAKNNVPGYKLLSDDLPRVHPLAYVSLIEAAHAAGVELMIVTSGWRPMLGSIAHRAGLGLDVGYLQHEGTKIVMNRAELVNPRVANHGFVSERERELYDIQLATEEALENARKEVRVAKENLDKAGNSTKTNELIRSHEMAVKTMEAREKANNSAISDWNEERNKNEPFALRTFRRSLARSRGVRQILDPWYMDSNSQDGIAATPNKLRNFDSNEFIHRDHLHITVYEPNLL